MHSSSTEKKTIVVLGSGFAAFSFLKEFHTGIAKVVAVSPHNYFLFTPLLPSTTVGTIEFRSIVEPIRKACPDVVYYQATAEAIEPTQKLVICQGAFDGARFELSYDFLVIAVGSVSSTYGIPGVNQHSLFLKDIEDARLIRQRIIECFERANQPGITADERKRLLCFVIVGGGPTGVEFAAELHDFLREDLEKSFRGTASEVTITLLEATHQILGTFDAALSTYTTRLFRRQGIAIQTGLTVARVENDAVVLHDGTRIRCGMVIWSTGIGPSRFASTLPFPKERGFRVLTDAYFGVKDCASIYAIGDCATIEGKNLPATAQVAQQEGRFLAHHLERILLRKPERPFRYRHYGMLAYVGGGKALADLASYKGTGFSAWLFWRSAYLTRLVSLKNKVLVLFDWFKAFFFGRDISRL